MTSAGFYLCMLMATAGLDGADFSLPLPLSQEALERATMYINQTHVVLYMADTKAPTFDERFTQGPVVRARGYPVAHGYVVSLLAREQPAQLRDALQKRLGPTPSLVVESKPIQADESPAPAAASGKASELLPVPKNSDAQASKHAAAASFPFGQAKPVRTPVSQWALVCGVALALCSGAWAWAKKHRPDARPRANIDVLAVRSLGSKHRLAVIDAGGERLLVCASSGGVTLLSHLSSQNSVREHDVADESSSFEDALRATDVDGLRQLKRSQAGQGSAL